MTCPFYVAGRHPCALGEPDGRHCGPRQYPVCVCNLDEIGRGEAWRAGLAQLQDEGTYGMIWVQPRPVADPGRPWQTPFVLFNAVGWSP